MSEPVVQQDNARSLHDETKRYTRPHQIIKNYALEVCQLMFSGGGPIDLRWDPDQEKTQIIIVDKYSFNLDQVATTPAIVANRGPQAWMKSSGFRQMQSMDMRTDRRTHTDMVQGSVVLSCFSRQGIEAEDIAGFLFEGFQQIRDILRKIGSRGIMVPGHLGMFKIEANQMGEEALVKSSSRPDLSVVPVALSVMVQRRWAVTPANMKLQKVDLRTSRNGTP